LCFKKSYILKKKPLHPGAEQEKIVRGPNYKLEGVKKKIQLFLLKL